MENWKKYVEATLRLERGNLFDHDERKVIKSIEERFAADSNAGAWDRLPRELQLMVMRGYADRKDRVGDSYETSRDIVKWRAENNVDALLDRRFDNQKKYYESWPSYITGTDDNGHLVNFERVEDINTTALMTINEADVLLMRAQHIEAINVLKHRASLAAGHRICKYIYIMDLKGLVIRKHFTAKIREVLKPIFQLSGDFYPDSLWSMFLVNSPLVFRMVWRVIAPMVDPVVKAKIRILNAQKDYIPAMEKAGIARSSIPRVIGGESEGQFMGDVVDDLYAHRQNPDNPKEDYLGPYPFEETMSGRKSNGSEMGSHEGGEDDPVFDEDSVIMSGYIKKRGSLNSAYKLRYFILTPSGLYYFSGKPTKGSQHLRGKIDLHLITSARMVTSNGFPTERPSAYFDVGIPGRMYHFWVDPAVTVQVVTSRRGSSIVEQHQPIARSSATALRRSSSRASKARGSNAKQSAASLRRNPTAVVEAQAVADAQAGFVSPTAVQWVSSISEAAENDRCALEDEVSHVVPNRSHSDHIKSGFLLKKGDIFQRWRKRYFVLTARRLYYYTDDPSKPTSILKGVIDLHMVSDSNLRHPKAATADGKFDLVTPVRVFRLRTLEHSDTQSWVDAVQEAATKERVAKQAARDSFRAMNDATDMPLAEEVEDSMSPIVRGLTFLSELSLSQVRSSLANASLTGAVDQIVSMSAEMLRVASEYNMLALPEGGEEQTQEQRMAIIRRRVMYMFTLPMGRRMRDKNEKKEQRASLSRGSDASKRKSSKRKSSKRMSVNRD